MTLRSPFLVQARLGYEGTIGTTAAAYTRLLSASFNASVQYGGRDPFKPTGSRYASFIPPGREWAQVAVTGAANYNEMHFFLASHLGAAGGSATTNNADGSYNWALGPGGTTVLVPPTFTLEQGDSTRMHRVNACFTPDFGLTWNRDDVNFTATMMGQRLSDNPGFTANPVAGGTVVPILPDNTYIYLCTTMAQAATATTNSSLLLGRATEGQLSSSGMFAPFWAVRGDKTSFSEVLNGNPTITLSLTAMADGTAMALVTGARTGTRYFVKLQTTSAVLAGTTATNFYDFSLQFAGEVLEIGDFTESENGYAIPITLGLVEDSTSGTAWRFDLRNRAGTLNSVA